MSSRASGYSYVVGRDGKKHRVYGGKGTTKVVAGRGAYRMKSKPIRGRGSYYNSNFVKTMNKWIPQGSFRNAGSALGGAAGSYYGNPAAGVSIGSKAGELASKILGFGAYNIKKNSLMSDCDQPARMHSNSVSTVVRHREYLFDIVSSSTANTFLNQVLSLNPGIPTTFPWLSTIANQFQEYKFLGLVFYVKTLSADAIASSTNTTLGGYIMGTEYNSALPGAQTVGFTNKQQMENTEFSASFKTSESGYHPIECDMRQNPMNILYTRSGSVPSGADPRMYDMGQFNIATFGVQGTSVVLGELWVSYEIQLSKSISTAATGNATISDHFQLGTVSATHMLGTTSVAAAGSSIGGTITGTGTIYNFPVSFNSGAYMFTYNALGSGGTVTVPTVTGTNCAVKSYNNSDTVGVVSNSATSSVSLVFYCVVTITAANALVTFASGAPPSSFSSGDLWVTQLDTDIVS